MAGAEIRHTGMGQGDNPTHVGYAPECFRLLAISALAADRIKIGILRGDVVVAF